MTAYLHKIGTPVFDVLPVGVSGLVNSDFTKVLLVNGATSTDTITISEIGTSGRYGLTFTPTANGDYFYETYQTSEPNRRWIENFIVRDDITNSIGAVVIEANGSITRVQAERLILGILTGRTTVNAIDPDEVIFTVRDHSNTKILAVFKIDSESQRFEVVLTP